MVTLKFELSTSEDLVSGSIANNYYTKAYANPLSAFTLVSLVFYDQHFYPMIHIQFLKPIKFLLRVAVRFGL